MYLHLIVLKLKRSRSKLAEKISKSMSRWLNARYFQTSRLVRKGWRMNTAAGKRSTSERFSGGFLLNDRGLIGAFRNYCLLPRLIKAGAKLKQGY